MRVWAFPSFYPYEHPGMQWGGIFAHRQMKGLIENGAEVRVVQPVYWSPIFPISNLHADWKKSRELKYPLYRTYDGVDVYHPRIQNLKPGRIFKKPYRERYVDAIIGFFAKNKITLDPRKDVFYSQWLPDAGMVQVAAKKLGVKSAVLVIGDDVSIWPHENNDRLNFFKTTWRNADCRLAVARYLGDEANKLVGENLTFHTVYRGVNYNNFKPLPPAEKLQLRADFNFPADKLVILTIGSAIERKGWLDLMNALQQVKTTQTNFVLAGAHGGHQELNLNEEAKKRGLGDNFINLGEVPPEKINRLYNAADIFCLPSHWEGIANSVVEAMATGLPVVTTNVCGHPELVTDGVTGIMVPPRQPALLSARLSAVLNDEALRTKLGNNARTFIVGKWGSFADNAAKLYKTLEALTK
jgi:teichuronic acid biosynthesis glycosyltransferase TuaC